MARYETRGNVAVIQLRNPPVNALSQAVRQALLDAFKRAAGDSRVEAIVICGHNMFSAGADISEFPHGLSQEPKLTLMYHLIEQCEKPVVAAIQGVALGGGLELALAAHYRVANKKAKVGFPEVLIGVLPGGTGTQRLPRLSGIAAALDLIISGRNVLADEALQLAIIDHVYPGDDMMKAGVEFARSVIGKPLGPRRISQMTIPDAEVADILLEEARKQVARRARGYIAPLHCIKAIEASVKYPYTVGLQKEFELLRLLAESGQSAAMRYAFFAERNASKWSLPGSRGNYLTVKPQPIKTAAVIGAGIMGSGIAMALISADISVILMEQNQKFLDRGVQIIQGLVQNQVKKSRWSEERGRRVGALLSSSLDYGRLGSVDLVIEAVYENMALKKEIFKKLDAVCKPSALLCSNTSTLDIDQLASMTSRPQNVAGTHFFSPPHIMKLLENIFGKQTSAQTISTIMQLGKTINKVPVLVGNIFGFAANRMLIAYYSESYFLVEEGSTPQEVDRVMEEFGMPMGPFRVGDLAGLDVGWLIRKEQGLTGPNLPPNTPELYRNGERYSPIADQLCERGGFGQKTGRGYYLYNKGSREPISPNPEIEEIVTGVRQRHNIPTRKITDNEIFERCFYMLVNEGFKLIENETVSKMEDLDIIWLYGFGWPRYTGGPMYHAVHNIGLQTTYQRICHYQNLNRDNSHWLPSDYLRRAAMKQSPASNL